ncbi:MAG: O-antigen ligase family protein [Anaerolineales bacterium]|nr:O-antigen ligase family protein [Anaerolineales bacterium]
MIDTFQDLLQFPTAPELAKRAKWTQFVVLLGLAGLTGVVLIYLLLFGATPASIAWVIFFIGIVLIVYEPRYGIYLILFFSLAGDSLLLYWYPFTKNLSSSESLMYLSNALIVSPAEIYMVVTFIAWFGRDIVRHKINFYRGQLFWPSIVFILFITLGLIWGVGRGGNLNIALWEVRAIFYLPLMLVLTNNLITQRKHASHLIWVIVLALFVESLVGAYIYLFVLQGDLSSVESLTEHSAAIHINLVIVLWLATWLFKGGSSNKRIFISLLLPTILLTYMAAQRRAAFLSLFIVLAFMVLILYQERRKVFWMLIPFATVIGLVYVAAFWNSGSTLALPVQAIKSVVAQDQANAKDQSSNLYRQLENINTHYTMSQAPLTGVGFGQKMLFIVPMPDISFFVLWEYITHNSILWIWAKAGVGTFISMLILIGMAILVGMRTLQRTQSGELKAIILSATFYIIMHFVYAYVDISWDNQSMLLVGTMMGLISCMEHVIELDIAIKPKRYPWQKDPSPLPGLLPLKFEGKK